MQIKRFSFKGLELEDISIDTDKLKVIGITIVGVVAIIAMPTPNLKLKALTTVIGALATVKALD